MTNSTAEFEVKEFVLPTFEVKIKLYQSYYVLKEASFPFNITAKYTYGKGINGVAYVRFGIIDEEGNRTFLPGIEQQISIQDGSGNVNLKTESLQKTANITHLEGFHLYIAVTVVETASGDLEETESSSVKFVITPYTVDLSRTKLTFTPGGPFSILAKVSYPDGTPASNLLMKAIVQVSDDQKENILLEQFGNNDGEVALTFNAPRTATTLNVKVIAEGIKSNDESLTVTAFQSASKSYLSIVVPHTILGQNDVLKVIFKDTIPSGIPRATYIYYMIISKGKTIRADRVQLTADTTISIPFNHDLVPAFRLIAYYYIDVPGRTEIIADSVWVDVEDVCRGKIRVKASKEEYKPAEKVQFLIEADQAGKVAVAVVDTAVYILNKQNKLTSKKIFDYMNSYDLGCSVGGGSTTKTVFSDAGLTFISSEITSDPRTEYNCKKGKGRQKRSFNFQGDFSKFVNQYTSKPLKKCCYDGAKLSPMNLPCAKRLQKVQHKSSECKAAFLKCCEQASDLRKKIKQKRLTSSLARVADNKEEDVFDETFIHLRSYFPQSWLWEIFNVPETGKLKVDKAVPDSLTTWEIQTIGISNNKGFCIAEPTQFRVFQDFFISLKLPYSVKRNEQLEVKAVVFNYQPRALEVIVKLKTVEGICSPGNADAQQTVTVPGNSAVPVYFSMVPLIIGDIPIHVTAYASEDISDAVEKKLKVVGEGVIITVPKEYNINGKTEHLTVDISSPDNSIPGLESSTFLSIKGGVMGESVENCLTLDGIDKLIQLPTGCAKQTMVKMSPAIHAIKYLDATEQWIYLKAERKDEAIQMIQSGYNRVLQHKKDDGSYGAFLSTPSSIWLTAFIAKELARSEDYISVEDQYIQQFISYIMSKQLPGGGFNDPNPLYDRTMQGGVGGVEGDVSLTAFVVIAMHHSLKAHTEVQKIQVNKIINEAVGYLKGKIMSLERPFAVAITAYALALVKPGSDAANQAQQRLRELAQCDEVRTICHWQANEDLRLAEEKRKQSVPQAESISVETTAYALLQTLLVNDLTYATPLVRWLTEQRKKGGGFRSTQDTVVALEALSQYSIQTLDTEDIDLKVELCFGKGKKGTVQLGKSNALTQQAIQVHSGANIVVNGQGKGNATLTVEHTYRTMKLTDSSCDYFNLHVAVQGEVQYKPSVDYGDDLTDYYNYEDGDSPSPDEPMSRIEWFDIRSRRRRDVADPKTKESTLNYNVCVSTKEKNFSGMAIVDISLLSGLEPDIQELQDVRNVLFFYY
ncbi:LOW QUALITY PROTEIN: complement C4-B-like [Polyodon spathula]|uniref:LOW QUALITY PROTEIN: complement C4-B-like n=1 Tax=Polyodon spathula TaxID=7913 RepID=UPI001B7E6AAA|nr:LOW QUALITY PROTEIN: complement C4-B-like [Polyodon spathula]